MRTRVLITGANGFLARTIADRLPKDWHSTALIRSGNHCHHKRHDAVFDSLDALSSSVDGVDVVFHLAAHIPADHNAPCAQLVTVNVDLVSRLVQRYPGARHVYASSVAAFGLPVSRPLTVNSPSRDPSRYGLSKLAGECVVRQAESHAVIRFSSLIGPGMKPGSFIPTVIEAAQAGCIYLFGDGGRLQNYLDIADAASMCLNAANRHDSFVTLGTGTRSYSNREIAEILAKRTGASIVNVGVDTSPSYIYDLCDAVDLVSRRTTLEEALTGMQA